MPSPQPALVTTCLTQYFWKKFLACATLKYVAGPPDGLTSGSARRSTSWSIGRPSALKVCAAFRPVVWTTRTTPSRRASPRTRAAPPHSSPVPRLAHTADLVRLTLTLTAVCTARAPPADRRRARTSASIPARARRQPVTWPASWPLRAAIGDDGAYRGCTLGAATGALFACPPILILQSDGHDDHGGRHRRLVGALRADQGGAGGVGGALRRLAAHTAQAAVPTRCAVCARVVACMCVLLRACAVAMIARCRTGACACSGG